MTDGKLTIGVIIGNANSPHAIDTINGIKQAAMEGDANVVFFLGVHSGFFYEDGPDEDKEESYDYQISAVYDYVTLARPDVLIISYGTLVIFLDEDERADFLDKFKDIPSILLESTISGDNSYYQIADNYAGMRAIVQHLTDHHAYRRFAYLSGPKGNTDSEERLRAFRDVLREHDIEISDDMIRYGDFSEWVKPQIEDLLDHNPDLQALVCANDTMACSVYDVMEERAEKRNRMSDDEKKEADASGYKYCVGRGIEEGYGIAVTGYDNWEAAAKMDPPLTTVVQSAYNNGYRAVFNAIELVGSGMGENIVIPPRTIIRDSCGCDRVSYTDFRGMTESEKANPEQYVIKVAEKFRSSILYSDVSERMGDKIFDSIYDIVYADVVMYLGLVRDPLSSDKVIDQIRQLIMGEYSRYISLSSLASAFSSYISAIIRTSDSSYGKEFLSEIMANVLEYIHSLIYTQVQETVSMYGNGAWLAPLISQNIEDHLDSEREMYLDLIKKIRKLGFKEIYLCMLDEPVRRRKDTGWTRPERLRLAAFTNDRETISYDLKDAPVITEERGLDSLLGDDGGGAFSAHVMNLYSGEIQYGLLIAKTESENIMPLCYTSLQISAALKYFDMARSLKIAEDKIKEAGS